MEGCLLVFLLLAQAVSASPPQSIDLTVPQPCQAENRAADEVVVCAGRNGESPYRLKQPAPAPGRELPKAELKIAEGVSAGAETEAADVGGLPSKRAMIRL